MLTHGDTKTWGQGKEEGGTGQIPGSITNYYILAQLKPVGKPYSV